MLADIDAACQKAAVYPDPMLSGHTHLYERYTRAIRGREIPYLVAGSGGYFNLSGFKPGAGGLTPRPPVKGTDVNGNPLTLEAFDDKLFGFLSLTVNPGSVTSEFVGVDRATGAAAVKDRCTLDLTTHKPM